MINFMKLLQLILLKYLEYKAFVFCSEGKNFLFCYSELLEYVTLL